MPSPSEQADAKAFVHRPLQGREPRRRGPAFAAEIADYAPPAGMAAVWYLSQATVVWKAAGSTLWIDPYLSINPGRRYPPLCRAQDVRDATGVLITHEHLDHLDGASCRELARSCPETVFVAPPLCRTRLERAGVPGERILSPHTGETVAVGSWRVTPFPAAHEEVEWTAEHGHRWTGYVAEADGLALYHAGDTVVCDELAAALLPWVGRLDLAMLPINGRDYFRRSIDILGNCGFREAAELAMRLGAGLHVPLHYDLFAPGNAEWPGRFLDYIHDRAPYLRVAVPAPGQRLLIEPRNA